MKPVTDVGQPSDEPADDSLDRVLAGCLEGSEDVEAAVERACAAHPECAAEIRRRIERLVRVGLLPLPEAGGERFPERLGGFRLLERLGGGGMGVVFRARQEALGREVALKLIRPEHLYFPRARARFRRETEAAARLQHPGIVPIHTVGEEGGIPFFAMELIHGATLDDALRELRPRIPDRLRGSDLAQALERCAPRQANAGAFGMPFAGSYVDCIVRIGIQIADALHHAHVRGVLHRDVKPSNVAVTAEGRALLFDFGLAGLSDAASRLTLSRTEIGSVPFMSPEQLRGPSDSVDRRSDVYSLGVTLYELLALELPFDGRDALETRRSILEGSPPRLRAKNRAVSRDLETVCAKAMERDPARRYHDAAALARDLQNVLERRPIEARPVSAPRRVGRFVRRHPVATSFLAALVLLPSALLQAQRVYASRLEAARDEARRERTAARLEARQAEEINDFLLGLFASVDPSQARGGEVTARDLLDRGAHELETRLSDQNRVRVRLLTSIGESYSSLGEWQRARDVLARALALEAGGDSVEEVHTLRALAVLENQLGGATALEHVQRAAELHRRLAPEPTFDLADTLLSRAQILDDHGRLDEAEQGYQEALDVVAALPGDQRPGRVGVLVSLANLYAKRRQLDEALATAREAVALQRELDPRPHPAISAASNTIALALTGLGRLDEAATVYEELLDVERQLTGENSARFATLLASRSNVEVARGDFGAAIEDLTAAARLLAGLAPPTHESAVRCNELLGAAYQGAARWQEALDVFADVLPLVESVAGAASVRALSLRLRMALCAEALSDWTGAEEGLRAALALAREAGSPDDDGLEAQLFAQLARFVVRRGDPEGARRLVDRARELAGRAGIGTVPGAWIRLCAGIVALSCGDLEGARSELEPLAALERRPPQHAGPTPAIARARLAVALEESDPERARQLARVARAELERELGRDHPETAALARAAETASR